VRITVLGKSPAWQDAGGACSGYLIEDSGYTLMLDCGNGVFGELRRHLDYTRVDAVLLTHLHADHFLDLIPYSHALLYSEESAPARPLLFAPPDAREALGRLLGQIGSSDLLERAFSLVEYDPEEPLALGPLTLRLREVPHYVRTFAVDVTGADGSRLTFSADCCPSEELAELARDTDLLLVEATLKSPERNGQRGHMTAAEAGEQARRAGARRVVLTHFSDQLDPDWVVGEARASYMGPVTLAASGQVFTLGAPASRVAPAPGSPAA
jgi:ribonuclease BN (tRNA processing enzyme)